MHAQQASSPSIQAIVTPDDLHKVFDQMTDDDKQELVEHLPDGQ
jgi:hypothetical protein